MQQDAFKDAKAGDAFAVTIAEDGYQAYTFTYKVPEENSEYSYVYVGMSWSEYWANEGVYACRKHRSLQMLRILVMNMIRVRLTLLQELQQIMDLHRGSFQCTAVIEDTNGKQT